MSTPDQSSATIDHSCWPVGFDADGIPTDDQRVKDVAHFTKWINSGTRRPDSAYVWNAACAYTRRTTITAYAPIMAALATLREENARLKSAAQGLEVSAIRAQLAALQKEVDAHKEAAQRAVDHYKEGMAACRKEGIHAALQFSRAADAANSILLYASRQAADDEKESAK